MSTVQMPDLVSLKATRISAPPAWALMERQLITLMEDAAPAYMQHCTERGGAALWADDIDDFYEAFYNWGLFYAMGADDSLLDMALTAWNASTRICSNSIRHREHRLFRQNMHREYYDLSHPGDAEWHHKGEGNMAFYDFGVAYPTVSENVRRARQFAGWYIGEDEEAPNYDPQYRILRSPVQTGQGPWTKARLKVVMALLQGGNLEKTPPEQWVPKPMGIRASLYPVVKELEDGWWKKPERANEIIKLFEHMVLNCDSANNLAATGLVTNAYLYTGEEKYKKWVLDYVEAWMERIEQNGGIIPDNVGPTGKVGEHRAGVWWGGFYGWGHYQGFNIIYHAINIAAECALLLSGDYGYLELLRSQLKVLLDHSIKREDGQLLVPRRYDEKGWCLTQPEVSVLSGPAPMRPQELVHLYHASMSPEDYQLACRVRDGDVERDWNEIPPDKGAEKNGGETELARFNYYDGKNPSWPEQILSAEYGWALRHIEAMRNDRRSQAERIEANSVPENPVLTKALTQVMLGAPQSVYNGGLLRAQVRYFDPDRGRPGVPPDVAVLVDELAADRTGIQLVNLNPSEGRNVIVQAGAFGEHRFTQVRSDDGEGVEINGRHVAVHLPAATAIRLEAGMQRFVNTPSYAFPWHGDQIPVPFQ